MTKCVITNCHEASIIKDPTDTDYDEEVIGTLKAGDTILVDTSRVFWSWDDKQYYKCDYGYEKDFGYINTGLVKAV